mmetsp:Transcript_30049/g.35710  ORF Transcript_30049/g.35710 Transcript_30049/m.35710 type:complete len:136 (-) Transcript_30049:540-947(-)
MEPFNASNHRCKQSPQDSKLHTHTHTQTPLHPPTKPPTTNLSRRTRIRNKPILKLHQINPTTITLPPPIPIPTHKIIHYISHHLWYKCAPPSHEWQVRVPIETAGNVEYGIGFEVGLGGGYYYDGGEVVGFFVGA